VLVTALILAGLAVVILQQLGIGVRNGETRPASVRSAFGEPSIVVLPFEPLGDDAALAALSATLTEEILLVVGRPEMLVVPIPGGGTATAGAPVYELNGSVRETDGIVRITARLVQVDTGTQLWSAAYDVPLAELRSPADQRRVVRAIATVAEPYGPVYDAELARIEGVALEELRTADCIFMYYEYRRVFGAAEYARALECFEHATAVDADNAASWSGRSLLATDGWAHGFGGNAGNALMLEEAREAARRAMDINGNSLHSNLALLGTQYFSGDEFREVADRILATWPENAEAAAYIGSMFILVGETERGRALVELAIEGTLEAPSGYFGSLALAALREQRYDEALAAALRIDAPNWALGQLVLAVAGALGGRADLADRARARLIELDPNLPARLPEVLRAWRVEPALAAEIERGLAAAGLPR